MCVFFLFICLTCVTVVFFLMKTDPDWILCLSSRYDVVRTVSEALQVVPFVLSNSRHAYADSRHSILVQASNSDVAGVLETVDSRFAPTKSSLGRVALGFLAGSSVKGYEHITQVLAVGRVLTVIGRVSLDARSSVLLLFCFC